MGGRAGRQAMWRAFGDLLFATQQLAFEALDTVDHCQAFTFLSTFALQISLVRGAPRPCRSRRCERNVCARRASGSC
jgi:hypothetical protein